MLTLLDERSSSEVGDSSSVTATTSLTELPLVEVAEVFFDEVVDDDVARSDRKSCVSGADDGFWVPIIDEQHDGGFVAVAVLVLVQMLLWLYRFDCCSGVNATLQGTTR